tara:strand:+ start:642 stop:1148 length:507 start_codon:yes stop_codon:yes gene_type:complete
LDCGAGCGMISKYIYAINNNIDITCIENNKIHFDQLVENFEKNTDIIKPDINVPANKIRGNIHNIDLPSNSKEFVFTCTVLMHIPYIAAVASLIELTRVSSKYICHIENVNNVINSVVPGETQLPEEMLSIDYIKLYKLLGYDIKEYKLSSHPGEPNCKFIYLLVEKK